MSINMVIISNWWYNDISGFLSSKLFNERFLNTPTLQVDVNYSLQHLFNML